MMMIEMGSFPEDDYSVYPRVYTDPGVTLGYKLPKGYTKEYKLTQAPVSRLYPSYCIQYDKGIPKKPSQGLS